ncbi:MAG: M23 family metallopeptidase [Bacteroidales bacterium]
MRKLLIIIFSLLVFKANAQTINDVYATGLFLYKPDWIADKFAYPVNHGKMDGYVDAQPFQHYYAYMGGRHLGADISGIEGGDSDLGDTIYCIGRGKVFYWFNGILMILHKTTKGYIVSQYRHCLETLVYPGQYVEYLQPVARIGNNQGTYQAHLHFEIRTNILLDVCSGYGNPEGWVDPMKFIENFTK